MRVRRCCCALQGPALQVTFRQPSREDERSLYCSKRCGDLSRRVFTASLNTFNYGGGGFTFLFASIYVTTCILPFFFRASEKSAYFITGVVSIDVSWSRYRMSAHSSILSLSQRKDRLPAKVQSTLPVNLYGIKAYGKSGKKRGVGRKPPPS